MTLNLVLLQGGYYGLHVLWERNPRALVMSLLVHSVHMWGSTSTLQPPTYVRIYVCTYWIKQSCVGCVSVPILMLKVYGVTQYRDSWRMGKYYNCLNTRVILKILLQPYFCESGTSWFHYTWGPTTEVVPLLRWSYYRGGPITEVVLLLRWSYY